MFHQLNLRVNFADANYSSLRFPEKDKALLRELALRVAELASLPVMQVRRALWTKHNRLEKTRPVLLCDPENGWNEIIPGKDIQCENSIARYWEYHFRKQIFWGERMNDDHVVERVFNLPYVYEEKPWRVRGKTDKQSRLKTAENGTAYHIESVLEDYSEIKDILEPEFNIDFDTTNILLQEAQELFGDVLETRINTVWFWSFGLTDDFVFMRGLEKLMYDFYDEPEGIHRVMELLFAGTMRKLDFLENNSLLCLNNDASFVGSGGLGFTDELPQKDFSSTVRTLDMWGLAESQVTTGVSPQLFEEFIFPYHKRLMERFGLTCYACCEPMDFRFDIVKAVKNLRRVSVSPWANPALLSEKLGADYIYSYKPSPTPLSVCVLDEEQARKDICNILKMTKDNCTEIIMKDNHTLGNNPANLLNWVRIVREEIGKM